MKRKQNLNVSCFVNFIKMGTAARNVNDKYIDPVKFGRLSVFPVGWRSEISHDTLYCYKRKNATLLYLFAWVVNGSWEGGGEEEWGNCPSEKHDAHLYLLRKGLLFIGWRGSLMSCANRGGTSAITKLGTNFYEKGEGGIWIYVTI